MHHKRSAREGGAGPWPALVLALSVGIACAQDARDARSDPIKCANLIYAGSKSSVCFSSKFLQATDRETNILADKQFTPVKLGSAVLFEHPFAIMTGEGSFVLREEERAMLKSYLERGGFLLASAGCSSQEWDRAFRREIARIFPDRKLSRLPMNHALFRTVFDISAIRLKNGGTTLLEGLDMNGRIALVYTAEGLNDTGSVKGCCCCGGNEIKNSQEVNVNIFSYAILH
jgi:hypothetical protein